MTYRLKLVVACLMLMSMTAAGIGFGVWSSSQLQDHLERSRLAHLVLEGHLQLKARTYKLFKQFADALRTRDAADGFDHPDLRQTLRHDIGELRDLIAQEVATVTDEQDLLDEQAELHALSELEEHILDVVREFELVQRLIAGGRHDEAQLILDSTLEQSIDEDFDRLIRQAIAGEMAEVVATDAAAAAMARTAQWLAVGLGVASLLVTAGVLGGLSARLRQPFGALVAGTKRLSQGDFAHRITVGGRDEFAQLAGDFNEMAAQLQFHRDALAAARDDLERTVAQRTAQLQAANTALQAADDARRRLFADISHELRTPLTVIRGEAEITLRGRPRPAEEYQTTLKRIVDQAGHTARLVDDLLFIARSDAGETRVRAQAVSLGELVEGVCTAAGTLAAETGIRVELQSDVRSAIVTGDPDRLRQALMIVVDNAVRYSRPHGTVRVSLHASTKGVCVTVADEGIGIPPDQVDRVFERFYRGGGADRNHPGGLGLGLPIAKAIIEAHDGEISLGSELGAGTKFTMVLPASRRVQVVG